MSFDINKFAGPRKSAGRYAKRLAELKRTGIDVSCISTAVEGAASNITKGLTRSFVIYGEPQSGKTEMMIALTARLLDDGHKIIIHLLNDSVQLLDQNLYRFQRADLSPAPCNYTDILDESIEIKDEDRVIFCKKNARDLEKLLGKIGKKPRKLVVDDEADYATPNAKVNQRQRTKINDLIGRLLGTDGIYIGVTATPARLDLNNTFENDREQWIDFPPHRKYTGKDIFFPRSGAARYRRTFIADSAGDDPKWCANALLGFLANTAYLNLHPEQHLGTPQNYSCLIHTSGKKSDHRRDYKIVQEVFGVLSNPNHRKYAKYVERLWKSAQERHPGEEDAVTEFVLDNVGRRNIVIMNSEKDKSNVGLYKSATSPSALFTVVIGGNIVSRGVTFDNLLSMYFTRDVKHKIQQDTYIQRARMFGSRGDYLPYFELTIPTALYADWHTCFVFHRLSLEAINAGRGAPTWIESGRIAATAGPSIDRTNVLLEKGEMSFAIFDLTPSESSISAIVSAPTSNKEKLDALQKALGDASFPPFLKSFIDELSPNDASIVLHPSHSIANMKDADQETISRSKGFMGGAAFTGSSGTTHHLRVLYNAKKRARLFYKYKQDVGFFRQR